LIDDKKITKKHVKSNIRKNYLSLKKEGFFYPIAVGSSGTIDLYDKFKREAIQELEKITPPDLEYL
jgi:hypothetical protein